MHESLIVFFSFYKLNIIIVYDVHIFIYIQIFKCTLITNFKSKKY